MSALQTGCFALHMAEQLLSSKNSTWIDVPHPHARCTCSTSNCKNGIELSNITPFGKVKVKIKNSFLICVSQLDASCQTDLINGLLTILSITVLYNNTVYCSLLIGGEIWGWFIHLGSSSVVINSGFSGSHRFWCYKGMKPPSMGGKGPSTYEWEYSTSGR